MQSASQSLLKSISKGINVIEASAGTGKTFHLSFLFIRLYLQHKIPLEKLCAITFTNLAITELRERIKVLFADIKEDISYRKKYSEVSKSSVLAPAIKEWIEVNFDELEYPQIIKDCNFALLHLHRSKITTIHSFFQDLLKRYYIYADLSPQFEIIAENNKWYELTAIWAKEFWLRQANDKNNIEARFFTHFFSTPEKLSLNIPTDSTGRAVSTPLSSPNWASYLDVIDSSKKSSKADSDDCERISKHYFKNQFLDFINQKTDKLVQNGQFSYNLILHQTLMVSKNAQFCANVRQDIDAILIDEFQDTDYIQWNVIKNIFLSKKSQDNILCLIGDPKQSIYRFRSADIDCYFEAIKEAKDKINLSLNWRSDKKLLNVLNQIYENTSLKPTPFEHEELRYTSVTSPAHKGDEDSLIFSQDKQNETKKEILQENAVVLRVPKCLERKNKNISQQQMQQWLLQDCLQLCSLIQQKKAYIKHKDNCKQLLQYSDILILCRTNDCILKISQLLQQYDIPLSREVRVYIWQSKAAQRVILLLQKLDSLSAKNHLTETDIISLSVILGYVENSENNTAMVENIVQTFHQWRMLIYSQGPLVLWQKILKNQCFGSFHIANFHLSNNLEEMTQLFEKLQVWWKEGFITIDAWLNKIQENINLNESHISQQQAIRLMTIHRAKGLEAPIVICPDLWDGGVNRNNQFTDYLHYSDKYQHYFLTEKPNLDAKKIEAHRLLYVALTRARSKLILYWLPYKHRGQVNSLETLLFIKSELGEMNEAHNLERLKDVSGLQLLYGDDKLLTTIKTSYKKITTTKISKEANIPDIITLTSTKAHSGLWSFTRLHRNQHKEVNEEYEKDKENEQYLPDKEKDNHLNKNNILNRVTYTKQVVSAVQLGTLVHKIIENILIKTTLTKENLKQQIVQETRQLLQNFNLNQEQEKHLQEMLTSLCHATLNCSLSNVDQQAAYPLYSSFWQKYCEVRFDVKVRHWQIEKLNTLCDKYPHLPIAPLNPCTIKNTLFYGFIDLVLIPNRDASTVWIVDFKSNFLGEQKQDYCHEKMHHAMLENDYGWQALFYALSIYRWKQSIKVNSASQLSCKIAYLFSRGLALDNNPSVASGIGKYELDFPQDMLIEISTILA